jgi:asparagine N-glycosylation enzyme membrane subunit Stt3
MKTTTQHFLILVLVILAAFIIHSSPVFLLPQNQYNFYDTDSWHFIEEAHDKTFPSDDAFPYFISLFTGKESTPLSIFNTVGFLPPILSTLFTLIIYFMVSRLFNEQTGFYSAIMIVIGTGIFFQNSVFGFIDHHLPQCILFTICILSILLTTKNKWWCVSAILSGATLYFISPVTWIMYYAIIAGVVWIILLGFIKNKGTKPFAGYLVLTVICAWFVWEKITALNSLSLWNWSEPINEIASPDVFSLLSHYNVLIIPVIMGLMIFPFLKFDAVKTALVTSVIISFILTLRFIRMELILVPLVIILSAVYLDGMFNKKTGMFSKKVGWIIICVFIIISAEFGCFTVSGIVTTSQYNERFNDAIQFIGEQPQGMTLSFWSYGNWLRVSGQPIYSDATQVNVTQMAKVFCDKTFPKEPISYTLVTEDDWVLYPEIQYYSGSKVPYEKSYLHTLIEGNETGLVYDKVGVRIYQHER